MEEEKRGSVVSKSQSVEDEMVEMEPSVPFSGFHTLPAASNKSTRLGPSSPASRFKGVVLQQNGHWGAQIYANHQRIWLGTFRTEHEAAMSYDSASIKIRPTDSYRNFPLTNVNAAEPEFQSHFSTEAVLAMIRDGTYPIKFSEFVRNRDVDSDENHTRGTGRVVPRTLQENNGAASWKLMFQKELTPSDVGKLNRVVIPKRYALKFFPSISESAEENSNGENVRDVELVFYDKSMKMWRFRYCYWTSSQSFVLTRGWNKFVRENQLEAKDIIMFFMCEYGAENPNVAVKSFCVIDANKAGGNATPVINDVSTTAERENTVPGFDLDLDLHLGTAKKSLEMVEDGVKEDDENNKSFKLFGVQIY